jgi:hypothetical protein
MSPATRAAVAVTGTLALTGLLASVALGDSCAIAVRWRDVLYEGHVARHATPERGASLGEGEIPHCGAGGRCAPPEEEVGVFSLTGVPVDVAIAAPGLEGEPLVFLAPGTFPALPDHPLHEAFFGSPRKPNYRQRCGEPFGFTGEVSQAMFNPRIRVAEPVPEQLEEDDDGQVWLELDANSRVEGFDRNGVATIAEGEEIAVTARLCEGSGEVPGPVVAVLRPG